MQLLCVVHQHKGYVTPTHNRRATNEFENMLWKAIACFDVLLYNERGYITCGLVRDSSIYSSFPFCSEIPFLCC
jgi:hypothetical protein